MATRNPSFVWRAVRWVPAAATLAAIGYFALKPTPARVDIPFMPPALGRFLDRHDFLCNVAGYVVLTTVVHATGSGWRRGAPRAALAWRTAGLAALVAGLECAQRWLPQRVFDLGDIAAGWVGVAAATLPWLRPAAPRPAVTAAERERPPR